MYSATASRVVTQFRPNFRARSLPCRARRPRCLILSPLMAAASESGMNSSCANGLPGP